MTTFKGACLQEVTHDEVYYVNTTTDGRILADIIFSVLCPRDCSGNGNCTNGNFMEGEGVIARVADAVYEEATIVIDNHLRNDKLHY